MLYKAHTTVLADATRLASGAALKALPTAKLSTAEALAEFRFLFPQTTPRPLNPTPLTMNPKP